MGIKNMLTTEELKTSFLTEKGQVKAVDGIDLELTTKENMALIGETGCGKSVLVQSILRLLPENTRISGSIIYKEKKNLLELNKEDIRNIRGEEIGLIPQSLSSLNPVMKIKDQIGEVMKIHKGIRDKSKILKEVEKLLELVRLNKDVMDKYPHMLSEGMKRRVLISIAIACQPALIIADEPTSGLDAMIKNKIMHLLRDISVGKTLLLITHDINVARVCESIAVMYAGQIVEMGKTENVLNKPFHPYTEGLLDSLPSRELTPIKGLSPSLINPPTGCKFHLRCRYAKEKCKIKQPQLKGNGRKVRCLYAFR